MSEALIGEPNQGLCDHTSRGGGIRTHDLFVPNHDTSEFD
ncbi:UNVERIFIED_ORG: hypothetical protein GGE11_001394 [Mycolicibacterium obuense]